MTTAAPILDWLSREGPPAVAAGNARFGRPTDAYGVPVGALRAEAIGTRLRPRKGTVGGRRPRAAHDGRVLGDPSRPSREVAKGWTGEFATWVICETACFHLYDRTRWRWEPIAQRAGDDGERVPRAAFALV